VASKWTGTLQEHGLIPQMLSASRFNRRIHAIADLLYDLQQQLGQVWMKLDGESEYLLDSFPVAVCDNIRIRHCHLLQGEQYRGYVASKKRYFYGIRIHVVSTPAGIPVEWVFLPGEANDTRGLQTLPLNLPAGSELYADKGYTDYICEDNLAGQFVNTTRSDPIVRVWRISSRRPAIILKRFSAKLHCGFPR